MANLQQFRNANAVKIGNKSAVNSISPTDVSTRLDATADEFRDRGIIRLANTALLNALSKDETRIAIVTSVGLFIVKMTNDLADNSNTFQSPSPGWLWVKEFGKQLDDVLIQVAGNHVYTLKKGYMIEKIGIKPANADTVKTGLTPDGDEIMFAKQLTPNLYGDNGVTRDIYADEDDVDVYFTGFTGAATIILFIRKLP